MSETPEGVGRNLIWRNKHGRFWSVLSVSLALVSLLSIVLDWAPFSYVEKGCSRVNVFSIALYLFWSLAPPIWFFVEYNYVFPDDRKVVDKTRDDLKYTQELAAKMWAALLLVLSVLLLLRYGIKVG
jgi:hypothetical protein